MGREGVTSSTDADERVLLDTEWREGEWAEAVNTPVEAGKVNTWSDKKGSQSLSEHVQLRDIQAHRGNGQGLFLCEAFDLNISKTDV